ncbi:uncharacterized protein LOC122506568 [Leptopilina heterotoma]|uniref:uncharacterized protein LOC122506568 n=1 Tax=Leptopilina heterotoma TaxID=63436 RepID=UPI001CAA3B4E|nr:uncharacterized protein LOC122506568 [Leptopilina heterotoma]
MENSNSLFIQPAQNYSREDKSPNELSTNVKSNNDCSGILQCFVCDSLVQGKHYTLASCKTQSTRTRVIEKLGELIGERYMIIISEEDIICRSCANLINTLDRLEMEMKTVKGNVLRYLERKYSFDNADLNTNDSINKSTQQLKVTATKEKKQNILNNLTATDNKKLISCDKCRYSTNHQTFMIHHLRQHINKKINCDKCGVQFLGNSQQNNSHCCKKMKKTNENVTEFEDDGGNAKEEISLPVQISKVENILMKDEINIESNLSDLIEDEHIQKEEQLKNYQDSQSISMTDENRLVENNDNSLRQILKVREDGSLEMIQMLNEN